MQHQMKFYNKFLDLHRHIRWWEWHDLPIEHSSWALENGTRQ